MFTLNSYQNMCTFNSGVRTVLLKDASKLTRIITVFLPTRTSSAISLLLESRVRVAMAGCYDVAFTRGRCDRPDVNYYCDLDYDPFRLMQDHEKVYGTSD